MGYIGYLGGTSVATKLASPRKFSLQEGAISANVLFDGSADAPIVVSSLSAPYLTGTIPSSVLGNSSVYIGTTSVALNRTTGNIDLTGITTMVMPGSTSGNLTLKPTASAGTTTITFPATTGTVVTTGDSGTVTNTMLAGSIANSKLAFSSISGISLGSNLNSLTIGTGLSGSSYNGGSAVTIAIDSTVATLSGSQALSNKTYNGLTLTSNSTGFSIAGGTTSKSLTLNNSLTFSGTDSVSIAFGAGGTVAYKGTDLSQFASTSSSQLAGVITDETGSGSLVFGTSPTFTTTIDGGATFGAFPSSTTLTIGYTGTGTSTLNISSGAVSTGTTKTINIGTGGAAGSTTNVNLGSSNGGTTTVNNDFVITGNLTVNGTTTTVNSTTISVDDKNIELGSVAVPSDTLANGGGLTLKGSSDKTFNWVSSTGAWTSSEHIDLVSGKAYYINGNSVLNSTTLGSGVTGSSLTSVGTITSGTWSGSFGAVSGANLTSLTAANLTGTIPSGVLGNSTFYVGTTAIALNRSSATQTLTGISIDGNAATASAVSASNLTGSTLASGVTGSSLTGVGTITSGTWSGSFGAVSGANLTSLTAANLTGTIPSTVLGNSTHYVGTTAIALNRSSASQSLTGVSIDGSAGSVAGTNITGATLASGVTGSSLTGVGTLTSGAINWSSDIKTTGAGYFGPSTAITLAYPLLVASGNFNSYTQVQIQNQNTGASASSDFIATADSGTDITKYIDLGINNSGFSSGSWTISSALDGYLYINGGNLTIGTDTTGKTVSIHTGGTLAANIVAVFNAAGTSSSSTTSGALVVTGGLGVSGTVTASAFSGSFSGSGSAITSLTAANLTGTIPSSVLGNSTFYVGTTSVALNRSSANQGLTGILSVTLPGSTSGSVVLQPAAAAGSTTITLPATTGTIITSGDSGTVTSTMIADGTIVNGDISSSAAISISKLAAYTISGVSLGNNLNTLTLGTGLTGTSYNGSSAITATVSYGSSAGTACQGNDSRLSDTRNTTNTFIAKFDSGATEGTDLYTFNGSSAKSINFVAGTNVTLTKTSGTITISANDTSVGWSEITSKPTTLSGYGITDAASSSHSQAWSTITSTPTTLSGYGITDAASSGHVHGNITNAGAIGSTANLPVITTTSGVLTTGTFGTAANTFCQGNDSRLSDARTPTSHTQAWSTITSTPTTISGYGITDAITTSNIASQSVSYASSAGNSDTCDSLHVHGSRNNEANKIVRTDGNGYIQCGYINSSNGNEGNNSNPARVWGTNGSDDYLRSYLTSALSVNYASSSGSCSGNAASATQLSSTQQTNVITGASSSMSMTTESSTRGSFICRAGGSGDSNLAGMTFWNDAYAIKLGIRADGYFGLGGWSRSAWSWYSDPSGNMVAAGNVTAYSDPRLKEEITIIDSAIEKIKQLNGVKFKWIDSSVIGNPGGYDYGILSSDVEKIAPELVVDSIHESEDGDKFKTVAYDKLVAFLIEAVKEQQKTIDIQNDRLKAIEEKLKSL